MKTTFDKMDINKDGHIDKDEMYIYIKQLLGMHHVKYQTYADKEKA